MDLPIKLDNYCLPETHDEHSCIFRSKDGSLFCLDCAIQSASDPDQLEIDRLWLISSISQICRELTEPQDLAALSDRVIVPLLDAFFNSNLNQELEHKMLNCLEIFKDHYPDIDYNFTTICDTIRKKGVLNSRGLINLLGILLSNGVIVSRVVEHGSFLDFVIVEICSLPNGKDETRASLSYLLSMAVVTEKGSNYFIHLLEAKDYADALFATLRSSGAENTPLQINLIGFLLAILSYTVKTSAGWFRKLRHSPGEIRTLLLSPSFSVSLGTVKVFSHFVALEATFAQKFIAENVIGYLIEGLKKSRDNALLSEGYLECLYKLAEADPVAFYGGGRFNNFMLDQVHISLETSIEQTNEAIYQSCKKILIGAIDHSTLMFDEANCTRLLNTTLCLLIADPSGKEIKPSPFLRDFLSYLFAKFFSECNATSSMAMTKDHLQSVCEVLLETRPLLSQEFRERATGFFDFSEPSLFISCVYLTDQLLVGLRAQGGIDSECYLAIKELFSNLYLPYLLGLSNLSVSEMLSLIYLSRSLLEIQDFSQELASTGLLEKVIFTLVESNDVEQFVETFQEFLLDLGESLDMYDTDSRESFQSSLFWLLGYLKYQDRDKPLVVIISSILESSSVDSSWSTTYDLLLGLLYFSPKGRLSDSWFPNLPVISARALLYLLSIIRRSFDLSDGNRLPSFSEQVVIQSLKQLGNLGFAPLLPRLTDYAVLPLLIIDHPIVFSALWTWLLECKDDSTFKESVRATIDGCLGLQNNRGLDILQELVCSQGLQQAEARGLQPQFAMWLFRVLSIVGALFEDTRIYIHPASRLSSMIKDLSTTFLSYLLQQLMTSVSTNDSTLHASLRDALKILVKILVSLFEMEGADGDLEAFYIPKLRVVLSFIDQIKDKGGGSELLCLLMDFVNHFMWHSRSIQVEALAIFGGNSREVVTRKVFDGNPGVDVSSAALLSGLLQLSFLERSETLWRDFTIQHCINLLSHGSVSDALLQFSTNLSVKTDQVIALATMLCFALCKKGMEPLHDGQNGLVRILQMKVQCNLFHSSSLVRESSALFLLILTARLPKLVINNPWHQIILNNKMMTTAMGSGPFATLYLSALIQTRSFKTESKESGNHLIAWALEAIAGLQQQGACPNCRHTESKCLLFLLNQLIHANGTSALDNGKVEHVMEVCDHLLRSYFSADVIAHQESCFCQQNDLESVNFWLPPGFPNSLIAQLALEDPGPTSPIVMHPDQVSFPELVDSLRTKLHRERAQKSGGPTAF